MSFIKNYQKYIAIVVIASILGFGRWIFLDKEFPLIGLSETQSRAIRIKQLSKESNSHIINFSLMEKIVFDRVFPIIDARDKESYDEGHIGEAINIDASLLTEEGDEDEINKLDNLHFFNTGFKAYFFFGIGLYFHIKLCMVSIQAFKITSRF